MSEQVSIKIEHLTKTFYIKEERKETLRSLFVSFFNQGRTKKFLALDGVNLDINKGEFFGLIGHNGSGKSTLLKIIARIYDGDKGSKVNYAGKLVPFLELGVGFNPDLTGRENVYLNGTILGMTLKRLDQKMQEITEFADLHDFIDMPVKNYSSGMMLRLAFSIAIQSDANIYLLDEVLGVGDENFQEKSQREINRLKAEGKTIIFVSHSMESIRKYCDRVAVLHHGKVEFVGETDLAIERYHQLT